MIKARADLIFLGLLGIFLATSVWLAFTSNYTLSANYYTGAVFWVVVVLLKIIKPHFGGHATALLLILGSLNIINFSAIKTVFSFGFGNHTDPFGIDPIMLTMLCIYYIINRKTINPILNAFLRDDKEEQHMAFNKNVQFYLTKFQAVNVDEFESIFKNVNQYPEEAQIALNQIYKSRLPLTSKTEEKI